MLTRLSELQWYTFFKSLSFDLLPLQVQMKAVNDNNMSKITIYKPLSKMCKDGKYQGCWSIYEDGTRMLITTNHYCKYATNDPFWKNPKDVDFKVKTRAQKKKLVKPKMREVIKYFSKEVDKTEESLFELKPLDEEVHYITAS